MKRMSIFPRENWRQKVEKVGLIFDDGPRLYWNESAYYQFSQSETEQLEQATNVLQALCLEAVQHVIDNDRFAELAIPSQVVQLIKDAWEEEPPAVYGRFDLAYDGQSSPKLLEYNADTPTALLEAGVVQWFWLEERFPGLDQFNSIHERLVAKWTDLRSYIKAFPLYFTCAKGSLEDQVTLSYLRDTADQAGLPTAEIFVEDIGWNRDSQEFVDLEDNTITSLFKLYPWEWLIREEFGPHLIAAYPRMQWIEPIWKMVLSNKGILPILWELFPNHPNLLAAYRHKPANLQEYVRKPLYSREGSNVVLHDADGKILSVQGAYGQEGFIYQQLAELPFFQGHYPVLGSWVIDGEAAGLGIREARTKITDENSCFVPHLIR